ncbi:class II aldolase/adducin family protein [Variovorax paradoxus]|nr:class II aldolase/adducin family protein [Variovorax paradoxus]MBT2304835.1 class II aldolase/adducin family protein [Variovorax paradoxus]
MTLHTLNAATLLDPAAQARVHLAAAYRLAVLHELEEGIDNHFTMVVPGREDQYLVLPFGFHWSEARSSNLVVFNEQGRTLEGEGVVELSAQCIHAPIHRLAGAKVVLHTHQTWTTALNMLQDNRVLPASQTAALFHGQIAYDDEYSGTAGTLGEGERLARLMESKPIVFMKNHGVLVTGDTVAQAYRRLYRIERVCRNQMLALATGRPLQLLTEEMAAQVQTPGADDRHPRELRERLFFEAMMRVLDRELPGYAD